MVLNLFKYLIEIQQKIDLKVIELQNLKKINNVSSNCKFLNYHSNSSAVSFFINADLIKPINNDLHSLGVSFTIFEKNKIWNFEGEVGFSSYDYGFDEKKSIQKEYSSLTLLLKDIIKQFDELFAQYQIEIISYCDNDNSVV